MKRKNLDYWEHCETSVKLADKIKELSKSRCMPANSTYRVFDSKQQIRFIGQQARECQAYQGVAPKNEQKRCKACSINPATNWYKKYLVTR